LIAQLGDIVVNRSQ